MPNPRKLLYPFSLLYDGITHIRNKLYDNNILRSCDYNIPVITVGNLNMGGTGKSPMIEYLLNFLSEDQKLATLSRGYRRESKGFQIVEVSDAVAKAGDEPLQFKNKFPHVIVAVDANRREGIAGLLKLGPEVILLDDAFQHRKVKAGFYILLTAYDDLYCDDHVLPAGNLRESASGAKRADVIIVTKCPRDLAETDMEEIRQRLQPRAHQKLFFTSIRYADKIYSKTKQISLDNLTSEYVLVTGIARPEPLVELLRFRNLKLEHFRFADHHNFSEKEIQLLRSKGKILTTEKDFMRLKDRIPEEQLFYIPIKVGFLNAEEDFQSVIKEFVNKK